MFLETTVAGSGFAIMDGVVGIPMYWAPLALIGVVVATYLFIHILKWIWDVIPYL